MIIIRDEATVAILAILLLATYKRLPTIVATFPGLWGNVCVDTNTCWRHRDVKARQSLCSSAAVTGPQHFSVAKWMNVNHKSQCVLFNLIFYNTILQYIEWECTVLKSYGPFAKRDISTVKFKTHFCYLFFFALSLVLSLN